LTTNVASAIVLDDRLSMTYLVKPAILVLVLQCLELLRLTVSENSVRSTASFQTPLSQTTETTSNSESQVVVDTSSKTLHSSTIAVTSDKEAASGSTDEASLTTEATNKKTEAASKSTEGASLTTEATNKKTEAASKSTEEASLTTEATNKKTEAASGSTEEASLTTEATNKKTEAAGKSTEEASLTTVATNKDNETASASTKAANQGTALASSTYLPTTAILSENKSSLHPKTMSHDKITTEVSVTEGITSQNARFNILLLFLVVSLSIFLL
ncbi:uncharacterized protein DEA37_0007321, partial [Paragonimus westermani]